MFWRKPYLTPTSSLSPTTAAQIDGEIVIHCCIYKCVRAHMHDFNSSVTRDDDILYLSFRNFDNANQQRTKREFQAKSKLCSPIQPVLDHISFHRRLFFYRMSFQNLNTFDPFADGE